MSKFCQSSTDGCVDEEEEKSVEYEEQKENHKEDPKLNPASVQPVFNVPQAEVKSVVKDSKVYTKIVPVSARWTSSSMKKPLEMKRNPQLDKLKMQHKVPLQRSTSLPESQNVPGHKTLHRTGSISDYTKEKLKRSILSRTSASLVRKPSITEQEIKEILTDPESSQSEEEEDMDSSFKPSDRVNNDDDGLDSVVVSTPLTTASVT